MNLWLSAADLRDYMGQQGTGGRYSDAALGSNIRAAQGFMERRTSRQFEEQTGVTKRLSSAGRAVVAIPDLRTATSISLQDSPLTADESYWLLPDTRHSGVYVNVQLRTFGGDYRGNPQWFDRNLDQPWFQPGYALPNDLVITGDWGWTSKPDDLLLGVKSLAAWLTKRADAVLAGAVLNPDTGSVLDYSQWPIEAQTAVAVYARGEQMASF